MPAITIIFAAIAGLFHILFFLMESIFYMNPKVHQAFGVRKTEDAQILKLSMFNPLSATSLKKTKICEEEARNLISKVHSDILESKVLLVEQRAAIVSAARKSYEKNLQV